MGRMTHLKILKPLTFIALLGSSVALNYHGQSAFQKSDPPSQSSIFDQEPPTESTDHLVFNSVSSLLQHWPNSRYRNGHTIVPATIPTGTLLYHGTDENRIPDAPEWIAFNPEHAFDFCLSVSNDSGCWQLTLMTTRPLKVLYFDGSSAAKMEGGTMDSQDLVIWGDVRPDKTTEEYERIGRLCEWGKQYKLDGFVRMTVNFEMMLCDFSTGVKTVTFLNLVPADSPSLSPRRKFPLRLTSVFRSLEAGTWSNHFPGETRLHLDYSRLVSFYDTSLFPSLQPSRIGQSRLAHRLETISRSDTLAFMARLDELLAARQNDTGSGIDWQTQLNIINYRFAERFEILRYILNSTSTDTDEITATLKQAYRHTSSMIAPYILISAIPPEETTSSSGQYEWAMPVFELCRTTHSREMEAEPLIQNKLTSSERFILDSTKGVLTEICRVLVGIWAEGRDHELDEPDITIPLTGTMTEADWLGMKTRWENKILRLMNWLDWSYWMRCRPACGYEEMCYMPTWPFFINEQERADPQPKCIRRVESFRFEDGLMVQG